MALDVLFSSVGDRTVDPAKIDLQVLDNTEALVSSVAAFRERMQTAQDGHSSKHTTFPTPRTPDVSDITIDLPDSKSRYVILLSMYELYNDRIFDLLDESVHSPSARRKALIFKKPSTISTWDTSREQKKVVSGLRKIHARTLQEALQVLEHGQATRTVSATNSNATSSRSHAFLQIEIKRFSARHHERGSASIYIVDLAGSERARTAKTAGDRLAEAGSINRSLMCLGQCLQLQTQVSDNGKPAVVPWRQSKLTELLFSNSFSGAGGGGHKTSMIVTADAMGDFHATSQILRYSALAREVTVPRAASRAMSDSSVSSISDAGADTIVESVSGVNLVPGEQRLVARLISQLKETEMRARGMEERWKEADGRRKEAEERLKEAEELWKETEEQRKEAEEQRKEAEERCFYIEQSVREEVADEMEGRLEDMRRGMMESLETEVEWRESYVDGKIEIMKRGIQGNTPLRLALPFLFRFTNALVRRVIVHEDAPPDVLEQLGELRDENERLRREVMQMRRDANNRSPSKQHKNARSAVKPLKDMLNLDAFRQLTLDGDR